MGPHRFSHWILIALLVLAAIFTLSEAHGGTSWADAPHARAAANDADKRMRPRDGKRKPARDASLAKDKGSTTQSAVRSVRRQAERLRNPLDFVSAR
ncbi:hypothetical protein [Ramlibacter sp.]|uniref:hypothetical protein n=1 Tax=Ramlibacter sp. TaxID=1917967 RepID=UPI003D0FCE1B